MNCSNNPAVVGNSYTVGIFKCLGFDVFTSADDISGNPPIILSVPEQYEEINNKYDKTSSVVCIPNGVQNG